MTEPTPDRPAAILFVCLGNICRSPLAEAAFRARAAAAGLDLLIDSAGTGDWHIGAAPDPRAQATAQRHGIDIGGYRGGQVQAEDFTRFTHIYALDRDNLANLRRLAPANATARLALLLDLVPGREGQPVGPLFRRGGRVRDDMGGGRCGCGGAGRSSEIVLTVNVTGAQA